MHSQFPKGQWIAAIVVLLAAAILPACGGSGSTGMGGGSPQPSPTGAPVTLESQLRHAVEVGQPGPIDVPPAQDPTLVALGRALFFDRILSGNRDISCHTCHDVAFATGDGLSVSIGAGGLGKGAARTVHNGSMVARNAPPLFNLGARRSVFWDGRVVRLEDDSLSTPEPALNGPTPAASAIVAQLTTLLAAQALFPVTAPVEMRGQPGENELADAVDNLEVWSLLMVRLGAIPEYRTLFFQAYPAVLQWEDFNFGHAARAIAAFEISAFSPRDSAFDRWYAGDAGALTNSQKRGGLLFYGSASCVQCHNGSEFSDGLFHSIGIPQVGPGTSPGLEDLGVFDLTGVTTDEYRFRTPNLRNVELTGPWMHDGCYTTLEATVRHYINPGASLANYDATQLAPMFQPFVDTDPLHIQRRTIAISPFMDRSLGLTDTEVANLVAFLRSLTAPSAVDLPAVRPLSVPSGLPIDD